MTPTTEGRRLSPWLTAANLADYLSVAVGTVRNWTAKRQIPYAKRGGVVRYHLPTIDAWLVAGGKEGAADTDAAGQDAAGRPK
jgi:excisionase family DNA binding protein